MNKSIIEREVSTYTQGQIDQGNSQSRPYSTKKRNNAGARAAALGGAAIAGIGGAYAANSLASDNDAPEVIPDEEVSFETPAPTPKPDAAQSTHNPSLNDKEIPDAPVEKMADIPAER